MNKDLPPAEFELKGQVLNAEWFLLKSVVEHDIMDKIVSAFNRTESTKQNVGDINRHFKKSLVGPVL